MKIQVSGFMMLCFMLSMIKPVSAQVNYARSTFTGTYTAISETGGATIVDFTLNNSTRSVSLPFNMLWNGTPFTTANYLAICTNGFAFFSSNKDSLTKASTPHYLFTTSNLGPNTIIAPWFTNGLSLITTGGNGKILTQVTAPNEFTIQWTDVWMTNSTAANPAASLTTHRQINFQIRLYGSAHATKANQIEFCYGAIAGTRSASESASIGLKVAHQTAGSNLDAVSNSVKTGNAMMNTNQWPAAFFRFTPSAGVPTPLAASTYTVGAGGNYTSLSAALADLNYRGIAGPVTFNLTDAVYDSTKNYFPLLLGPVAGSSAGNRITIQGTLPGGAVISSPGTPAGNIANMASSSAIGSGEDPVLGLIGSSYVTLKNLTLEAAADSIVNTGLLIANASPTSGASNDSIVNVKIRLKRLNASSVAILQKGISTATGATGANSDNKYLNIRISNAGSGIQLNGTPAFADQNTEVGILNPGDSTIIGADLPNDMGGGTAAAYGIQCIGQNNIKIQHTIIRNITGNGTSNPVSGITCEESTSGTTVRTYDIYNNRIYNLSQLSASTSAGIVYGINSSLTNNAASVSRIYNNFVTGLNSASAATTTRRMIGIMASGSTSTTANYTFHVDFNTVIMNPDAANCSNTCFEIGSATSGAITQPFNVRNNIFANYTGSQSGSFKHYCWSSSSATSIGSGISNRNILYTANTDNGFTGRGNTSDFAALFNWKTIAANVDVNSRSENPQLISLSNYKINTTEPTPVESNGSFFSGAITWVPKDMEGNTRNSTTPDIGAYEGAFTAFADNDLSPSVFISPAHEDVLLNNGTNNTIKPVVRFKNNGVNAQTNFAVRYRITGPLPATTEIYNQVHNIASLGSGATVLDTFPVTTLSANGIYTLEAITELGTDNVKTNDTLHASIAVLAPLSGTIAVGQASALPYNTLTNAIKALNNCGVSAAVNFSLTDSVYSASETFPIEIKKFAGAAAANPVTIKPAGGVQAKIRGNSNGFIIRISDASYTTIDGANTASGTTRDLSIINETAIANSGAVWISSSATGANPGATNNTVKNCLIKAGSADITSTFGVYISGTTVTTTATGINNDNITIQNNKIERAYRGIYARATSTANGFYDNLVIADNEIGSDNASDYVLFRGVDVTSNNNLEVRNNKIYNLRPALDVIAAAIELGTNIKNSRIYRNRIDSIGSSSATAIGAYGIAVTGSSADSVMIYNNFISTILMNTGGTGTANVANGIRIAAGTRIYIQHNSVNMGGIMSTGASASAALMIVSTSATPIYVNNNVFVNRIAGTAVKSYSVYALAGVVFNSIDNNAYYAGGPNGTLGFLGADKTNMNQWRAATGQDLSSFIYSPSFLSAADLHIANGSASAIESVGMPLSYITTDIDNDPRSAGTPDVGADEFNGTALDISPPGISYTKPGKTSVLTNRSLMATISDNSKVDSAGANRPRIYYKKSTDNNTLGGNTSFDNGWKFTEATNDTSPFHFVIDYSLLTGGSAAPGDAIQYFIIARDLATSFNVGVNGAEFAVAPTAVILTASDFPVTPVDSYRVVAAIPATVNVGTGQPFTSLTNAGGLFEAMNTRILTSDVTVRITSDLSETGVIALNEYAEDGAGNYTVTIQPDAAANRTISGSISRKGLINLNATDRFILDGRFNGSGNYLTIVNNASGTGATKTAVINLIAPGTSANPNLPGCENVTIRNCNIVGGTMHNTSSTNEGFMGIYCGSDVSGGASIPAAAFNNRFKVIGNRFARMGTGIYLLGYSTAPYNEITIDSNEFGSLKDDSTIFFQAFMILNVSDSSLKIRHNLLQNFVQNHNTYSSTMYGMQISGCTKAEIAYNTLRNFKHLKGGTIYGIQIGTSSTSADDSTLVHNNQIYNLYSSNSTSTVGVQAINISSKNILVYHNTINLFNSITPTNGSSACIYGAQTGTTGMNVRNNILSNTFTAASGAKSYGLYMAAAAFGVSDYNAIYVPNGVTGKAGTPEYVTLADWKAGTLKDASSVQVNPLFNSDSILVLLPSTTLKGAGVAIPAVPSDITGATRNNPPSIGAYENTADLVKPVISYTKLLNGVAAAQRTTINFASITDAGGYINLNTGLKPRMYYKRITDDNTFNDNTMATTGWKYAETFSTAAPFDFVIDYSILFGGAPVTSTDTIQYFVVAQDTATLPNVAVNSATLLTSPASVNLSAAHFPATGAINYYLIANPLSGSYLVGTGNTWQSLTGNGGAFEVLNNSALSGNVELWVITDLVETGTHALNAWAETGAGHYTVTITPYPSSGSKLISGSSKTPLIRINGADRLIIDGSDGSMPRALTFANTDTAAVIQVSNQSGSVSIRNAIVKGNTTAANTGLLSVSNDCDSMIVSGNLFAHDAKRPSNAILFSGSTGTNDRVRITGNEITNFSGNGIMVAATGNGSNFTISNNHFYHNTAADSTSKTAINFLAGALSENDSITGNFIGGQAINAGGSAWQHIGTNAAATFKGIAVNAGNASAAVVVSENVIRNLALTGTTASMSFTGIDQLSGSGRAFIDRNVIGDSLTTDSIVIYGNASGSINTGINAVTASEKQISNNKIQGITSYGVNNNSVIGINITGSGKPQVTGNTIYNLYSAGSEVSQVSARSVTGIFSGSDNKTQVIRKNMISHLVSTGGGIPSGNSATIARGIMVNTTGSGGRISQNKIQHIKNLSTGAGEIHGVYFFTGASNAKWTLDNNQMYLTNGTETNSIRIEGVHDRNADNSREIALVYNTIYIGGTVASGSASSACYQRLVASSCTLENNIFYNERSGGSGRHTAISNLVSPPNANWTGTSSNYNLYVAADTASVIEWGNAGTVITPDSFRNSGTSDQFSYFVGKNELVSPNFFQDILSGNLAISRNNYEAWAVNGKGKAIDTIAYSFYDSVRSGTLGTPTDIGADEFSTILAPALVYTPVSVPVTHIVHFGRRLATINWNSGTAPATIESQYFSGVTPPSANSGSKINSYTLMNNNGGSAFGFDMSYAYSPAEIGTIAQANLKLAQTTTNGNTWNYFASSVVSTSQYTVSATGLNSFGIVTLTDLANPLPVKLASFTTHALKQDVIVRWSTASETNADHFVVQASADGKTFVTIGSVKAKGNTSVTTAYSFMHRDAQAQLGQPPVAYYRLISVDANGTPETSETARVAFNTTTRLTDAIIAYPNPFSDQLTLSIPAATGMDARIEIADLQGRIVASGLHTLAEGANEILLNGFEKTEQGIYFIRIVSGDETKVIKVIKN